MYSRMGMLAFFFFALFLLTPSDLPAGNGKEVVARACTGCHTLKVVTSKRATPEQWSTLVSQMVSRGADVDDDDIDTLVAYLSKNFPPATKMNHYSTEHGKQINVNQANAKELASMLGLSEKDASAIIAYRKQNGDFKTLADLTKVPGIDRKKIENDKTQITF
jgi:competence protein ComEA